MSEPSDIQTGEIPLDELYDVLRSYRDEYGDYVLAILRGRIVYESVDSDHGYLTVRGSITHIPGSGDFSWWLGIHDELRGRLVGVDLSHNSFGKEVWLVVNDSGRKLGELKEIEVGIDV